MARILVEVVDEKGRSVDSVRVAFSARVITPRFILDEAEVLRLSAVNVRMAELAVRTDRNGFAEISDRPAPKVMGPLGPLYILGRAANMRAPTPYVDWLLMGGKLMLHVERTGYAPVNVLATPGVRVEVPLRRIEGPTVRGRVIDSAGRLVWGAFVEVLEEERGPVLGTGHSDAEGRFEVSVRRPGSFTVRVFPPEEAHRLGELVVCVRMVAGLGQEVRTLASPLPQPAGGTVAAKKEE